MPYIELQQLVLILYSAHHTSATATPTLTQRFVARAIAKCAITLVVVPQSLAIQGLKATIAICAQVGIAVRRIGDCRPKLAALAEPLRLITTEHVQTNSGLIKTWAGNSLSIA
jgi:hypothetical protein